MQTNLKRNSFLPKHAQHHYHDGNKLLLCIVPRKSFRLEKINGTRLNQCLTVTERGNNRIFGISCTSSLNMRWISIQKREGRFQLINVMTLQCLELVEEQSQCKSTELHESGQVAMKQCKKRGGQYMVQNSHNLYASKLCGGKNYYLRLETDQKGEEYRAYSQRNMQDSWFNEDKNRTLKWENIPYRGECHKYETSDKCIIMKPFEINILPTDQLHNRPKFLKK